MTPLIVNIGKADVPNANGRVYPRHELERAILDIERSNSMGGRVIGQVGMPSGERGHAELEKMAFVIGNLHITDDGEFKGEVVWLETPAGKQARSVYEAESSIWFFRPCGIAKLRGNEIYDYRILSINMVLNGA